MFRVTPLALFLLLQDDVKKIAEDVAALQKDVAALTSKMDKAGADVRDILKALSNSDAFPRGRMGSNERNAVGTLAAIWIAQENFKANDVDRNGVGDYWTGDVSGLYWISNPATMKPTACLSDLGAVYADLFTFNDAGGTFQGIDNDADGDPDTEYMLPAGIPRAPKTGYWYQAMIEDEHGNAYAMDTDGQGNCHNYSKFAVAAIPAAWDSVGRNCYIINESGDVYRRDFGRSTTEGTPWNQATEFAPGIDFDWPDAETLKNHWTKVEREAPLIRPHVVGFRNAVTWTCGEKNCKAAVEAVYNAKLEPKCASHGKAMKAPEIERYACAVDGCKKETVVEKGDKPPKCCGKEAVKKEK